MRLRNVKGSRERIASDSYVVQEPALYKGKWNQIFGNANPVHIEIGMGKGKFIQRLAAMNPDINYIGIEKYSSVLVRALERRPELETDNLIFIRMDAETINDIFAEEEIGMIYLNFSDPWPKDRHAKRRLTSKEFFARYNNILSKAGKVIFKTDNRDLFDFSVEEAALAGWQLENITRDLHASEYKADNVMTEYEEKFVSMGNPIYRLIAVRDTESV